MPSKRWRIDLFCLQYIQANSINLGSNYALAQMRKPIIKKLHVRYLDNVPRLKRLLSNPS